MDNKTQTAPSKWHKKLLEGYARHTQKLFAWNYANPATTRTPEEVWQESLNISDDEFEEQQYEREEETEN